MDMTPNKPIRVVVSDELRTAISAKCSELDVEMSEYIRRLIIEDIGRPDLQKTIRKEGRPPQAGPSKRKRKKP